MIYLLFTFLPYLLMMSYADKTHVSPIVFFVPSSLVLGIWSKIAIKV